MVIRSCVIVRLLKQSIQNSMDNKIIASMTGDAMTYKLCLSIRKQKFHFVNLKH